MGNAVSGVEHQAGEEPLGVEGEHCLDLSRGPAAPKIQRLRSRVRGGGGPGEEIGGAEAAADGLAKEAQGGRRNKEVPRRTRGGKTCTNAAWKPKTSNIV